MVAADTCATDVPSPAGKRTLALLFTLVTLAVAAPAIAAIITRWGTDYLPVQDIAVIDLRVRDVFSAHPPLAGVYSQFGWNHPGPLMFWALAAITTPLGGDGWSLVVAAATLQAAAVVATGALAWRWGGPWIAVVTLTVIGLSYGAAIPWAVLEAWNPNIALPFLSLLVLSVWKAADGPGPALPIAAGVGSFLVQTHVGYAPLVAAAGLWLVATVLGRPNRARWAGLWPVWRGSLLAAALVAGLAWAAPMVEAGLDPPGNPGALADYFIRGDDDTESAGPGNALHVFAGSFRVPPPWLGGPLDTEDFGGSTVGAPLPWLLVPLALVAAGALLAPHASLPVRRGLTLAWTLNLAGLVAMAFVQHPSAPYLFLWRTPLAVFLVVITGAAAVDRAAARRPRVAPAMGTVALIAAVATSLSLAQDIADTDGPIQPFEPSMQVLLDQLDTDELADRTVVVDFAGSALGGLQGGLTNWLDRNDVPFEVDEQFGFQFGEERAMPRDQADEVWLVVEQGSLLDELSALPGAEIVARTTPLGAADDTELRDLQRAVTSQLVAAGKGALAEQLDSSLVAFSLGDIPGIDHAQLDRLAELNAAVERADTCRCGIVALPPERLPEGVAGVLAPLRPVGVPG